MYLFQYINCTLSAFPYVSISYFYRSAGFGLSVERLLVFVFKCSHK